MNTMIRNALCAVTVVGALSLAACKTTEDSMDDSMSAPTSDSSSMPAEETPMQDDSSSQPMDDSGMDNGGTPPTTP